MSFKSFLAKVIKGMQMYDKHEKVILGKIVGDADIIFVKYGCDFLDDEFEYKGPFPEDAFEQWEQVVTKMKVEFEFPTFFLSDENITYSNCPSLKNNDADESNSALKISSIQDIPTVPGWLPDILHIVRLK